MSGQRMTTRPDSPRDIAAVPVSAVMSTDVLAVHPQDPVVEVWQRMRDRRTPIAVVCEGNRVLATVSQTTLAVWWPSGGPGEMRRRRVRDVIEPGTPTLHPNAPAHEAAELIIHLALDGVPIVTATGTLLGLVTPTGLLHLLTRTASSVRRDSRMRP